MGVFLPAGEHTGVAGLCGRIGIHRQSSWGQYLCGGGQYRSGECGRARQRRSSSRRDREWRRNRLVVHPARGLLRCGRDGPVLVRRSRRGLCAALGSSGGRGAQARARPAGRVVRRARHRNGRRRRAAVRRPGFPADGCGRLCPRPRFPASRAVAGDSEERRPSNGGRRAHGRNDHANRLG
jgi:hypothetical protein